MKGFVVLISLVVALGGLLFGFDTAIISGAIPLITTYFKLDEYLLGWAVGAVLIGCAAGALFAGMLADRYGRRLTLGLCALLFAFSGIGAGLSHSLGIFIAFRLAGGLGVGIAAMVSPMYIAETAPAAVRGRLVSFYQLAIVAGILLAYFSNYLFSGFGAESWRWMFASQSAPALLFLFLLFCVPETPRWLISRGKKAAALAVLEKTSGVLTAQTELKVIEQSFKAGTDSSSKLFQRRYWRLLVTGIGVAVIQQVTGINAILYYAPVIFKATGLSSSSSLLQTIGIGVVNLLATFIAIALVDKAGRRKFLLTGSLLMGASLALVAACFHFNYFGHYIVLAGMLIYVGAFGCTLGAVTWVYLSEIFPNAIRGLALSAATLALWVADFVVAFTFPALATHLGLTGTLSCYAVICLLAFAYLFFAVRETRGKPLEEIENLFINQSYE